MSTKHFLFIKIINELFRWTVNYTTIASFFWILITGTQICASASGHVFSCVLGILKNLSRKASEIRWEWIWNSPGLLKVNFVPFNTRKKRLTGFALTLYCNWCNFSKIIPKMDVFKSPLPLFEWGKVQLFGRAKQTITISRGSKLPVHIFPKI